MQSPTASATVGCTVAASEYDPRRRHCATPSPAASRRAERTVAARTGPPLPMARGAGTDIIRELRPNQDDDRRVPGRTQIGATVSPGHVEKEFNLTCRSPRRAIYPAAPMAIEQCHRDMLLAGSGDCACSVTIVLIIAIIP